MQSRAPAGTRGSMPLRLAIRISVATVALFAFLAGDAPVASADQVDDLISLVRQKPAGQDDDAWRESRREAAVKLGKLGDARAVPALIEVVETETFDVVAEHAIEALGKLGDKRALPALRQVAADRSRDRYARRLAKKAIRKLGGDASAGSNSDRARSSDSGAGSDENKNGSSSSISASTSGLNGSPSLAEGPTVADDVLGSTERLTFSAGAASLQYDSVRKQASLDGSATARYWRTVERESIGYEFGGNAALTADVIDPDGDDSASRLLSGNTVALGEARFYLGGGKVYGLTQGGLGVSLMSLKVNRMGADNTTDEKRLGIDAHVGLGVGYGRMLDLGEGLRLRRIERALERARALGRPISGDLAAKVMRAWWVLRGEQGVHRRLLATVKLLREAGVLLGEPDASTTYQIIRILEDGQLNHRLEGLDVRLGIAESFLVRDADIPVEDGRIETVLLRARYGRQSRNTEQELVGEAFGRLRVLAEDGDRSPWSIGAAAAWRSYVYNDARDPIGALELSAELGLSDDDIDGLDRGTLLAGSIGWLWSPNRASRFRVAGRLAVDSGALFLGATFEATYGFLDAGFVGTSTFDSTASATAATQ